MLCVEQTCTVCGGRCLHIRGYIGCFIQSRLNQCALTEMRRCHVVRISKTTKLTSFRRPYCLHCMKAKLPQSFFEICYVLYLNKTWIIYVFKKSLTTKRSTIIVTNISKNYQNLCRIQIVLTNLWSSIHQLYQVETSTPLACHVCGTDELKHMYQQSCREK